MSQVALPLLARTDGARADEETAVRIAWALDGGRPVHISRYSHLRGAARPELSCLGCTVSVVPVLPRQGKGNSAIQEHFRHKQQSPKCWAHHGLGAQLWNATLHLHRALDEAVGTPILASLGIHAPCDPVAGTWAQALPLFRTGCTATHRVPVPRFDRVGLSPTRRGVQRAPDVRLWFGSTEVLRIRVVPADPLATLRPLAPETPSVVEVHLDQATYPRIVAWEPIHDSDLPCTRATPDLSWRCPVHR